MTTLGVGGPARRLAEVDREADAIAVVSEADAKGERLLVLGGGSNLVVADEGFPGTVLRLDVRGVDLAAPATASQMGVVLVTAAAGEPWDDFVTRMVDDGLSGVECLAGIPGRVGAVPMQNVGAYGQDVSETIVRVRTWDRRARRIVDFERAACRFAYRSSVFRGKDDHVILGVTFALERSPTSRPVRYAELARALGVREGDGAPLRLVRDTIVSLRKKKGMVLDASDPDTRSAGSFFTNPILDDASLALLRERVAPLLGPGDAMPLFPEPDGRTKVSAAWLIERAGFTKGYAEGAAAISTKHALALTNRGGATARDILSLARTIQGRVKMRFGVMLEPEPIVISP